MICHQLRRPVTENRGAASFPCGWVVDRQSRSSDHAPKCPRSVFFEQLTRFGPTNAQTTLIMSRSVERRFVHYNLETSIFCGAAPIPVVFSSRLSRQPCTYNHNRRPQSTDLAQICGQETATSAQTPTLTSGDIDDVNHVGSRKRIRLQETPFEG